MRRITKVYKLNETEYLIPVKKFNNSYSPNTPTINFLLIENNEEFSNNLLKKRLSDLIVFLNYIWTDSYSSRWLVNLDLQKAIKTVKESDSLKSIFDEFNSDDEIEKGMNLLDFQPAFYQFKDENKFNIVDLYNKFCQLDESDKLRQQIELYVFAISERALLGNFYSNGNLQISLLYTLVDSIMKDILPNTQKVKKCEKCGFEKNGKMNDRERIKEFSGIIFKDDDFSANELNRILIKHYQIRNNFFHEGRKENTTEILNLGFKSLYQEKGRSEMSLEEEIDFSEGRLMGMITVRNVIGQILIEKLLKAE